MNDAPMIERLLPTEKVTTFTATAARDEDVLDMLQAARLAPSANNSQIWFFTIVRDAASIRQAAESLGLSNYGNAPIAIAAQATPGWLKRLHKEQPFFMIDVPIAMSHLSLAAREKALAIEWHFPAEERALQKMLALDARKRLVALGFCGEPADLELRQDLPRRVFINGFDRQTVVDESRG